MLTPIQVPATPAAIAMLETFADILSRNAREPQAERTQPQQEHDAA